MDVRRGFECLSSCIANRFSCLEIPVQESDIFLCGGGYRIRYSGDIHRIEIGADAYRAAFRFLDKYKVEYQYGRYSGADTSLLCRLLQRYGMLLVRTVGARSYHKVFEGIASPHWILVTGQKNGVCMVVDAAIPDVRESVFCGEMPADELVDIWGNMDYEYMIVDSYQPSLMGRIEEIREQAQNEWLDGMVRYFHPKKHWFSVKKEGCESVISLLSDYIELAPQDKNLAMTLVQEINDKVRMGGVISYKKAILQKMISWKVGENMVEEYQSVIETWHDIFLRLLKAAIKCDMEAVVRLKQQAEELVERERECAEFIMKENGMKPMK